LIGRQVILIRDRVILVGDAKARVRDQENRFSANNKLGPVAPVSPWVEQRSGTSADRRKLFRLYQMATLCRDAATPIADAEAIKDCIRRNEHMAITLYRDFSNQPSALSLQPSSSNLPYFQDRLPLHAINS